MIATAKPPSRDPVSAHFENGDLLTLNEFLRRYEQMPHVKKAELIEGIVHMASPVRVTYHSKPNGLMQGWLCTYAVNHDLEVFPNATLLLAPENCFQQPCLLASHQTRQS